MALDRSFQFQVDEQYKNEKGIFTVLAIKGGEMEIQWEDGEKIVTAVDLQRSIQIRREMEKIHAEAEAAHKKRTAAKAAGVKNRRFDGFVPDDFKESAARTRWRGRDQLGGAVSQKLPREVYNFLSWAVAQRSEIHWQDANHRKRGDGGEQAVFFVKVDTQTLTYGFKVMRASAEDDTARDWQKVARWLKQPENAQLLHTIAAENDLSVSFFNRSDVYSLEPVDEGWQAAGESATLPVTHPAALMGSPSKVYAIAVEIAGKMKKADALARGGDIAVDIAALCDRLMLMYQIAVA